jgi:hypothetical protein
MLAQPPARDPSEILDSLDPATIEASLADLQRQERALKVLLRAARARGRRERSAEQREGNDQ